MAKKKARGRSTSGVNKTKFIRDLVEANKSVPWSEVEAAWKAAGHSERLNPTLYYHVRNSLGLVRKQRKRRGGGKAEAAPVGRPVGRPAARSATMSLVEIERDLDQMISNLGGTSDLAEALRNARRLVSARIIKTGA